MREKKIKNPDESHNTPAVAQGSVNDWICWIGASGLRPVGSSSRPAAILCPPRSPLSDSHAHLQSACVVFFMWSIFSSPATGSFLPGVQLSSERRSRRRIPAESSKAAPSLAWCTIKDHEGRPESINSLPGIRLLFWLTRKDGTGRNKKKKKKSKCEELETVLLCDAFLWRSFEL